MMRAAHGTGSQRESSGCTEGSPVRLAMVAAVAVIIVMPSLSAAQEPPETPTALSRLLDALVTWASPATHDDEPGLVTARLSSAAAPR